MIVSHTYRYVFVELPRTGSTAISKELCTQYDGRRILDKHSTYNDFLKVATEDEKNYFVFSGIRNPLDDAVSRYFKLKTDHKDRFTSPVKLRKHRGVVNRLENVAYWFVNTLNADFPAFFLAFYWLPYNNWSSMAHRKFDFVMRFESLADDFDRALRKMGVEPKRPLPVLNKTAGRTRDYLSYFTPSTIRRAKWVFGPFMKRWGYEFPPEWGATSVPWWNDLGFAFVNLFRGFYWHHLRYRI